MEKLNGWRTVICCAVAIVLSVLAAKGKVASDAAQHAGEITDQLLSAGAIVSSAGALVFRLIAKKPGPLADTK